MQFNLTADSDTFRIFPYPPDRENGRSNNGGIDLISEPHRIVEITEINDFPAYRTILKDLNSARSKFMTLGCDAGDYRDHCLFGYLEVCARTPEDIEYYADILKRFGEWVDESLAGIPVDKYLNFAWANFDYPDKKYQGAKLVCYFQGCGRDVEEAKSDASNAISSFAGFLLNVA